MTYLLPTDIRARIQALIAGGGDFQSEHDVLRAAMDALDQLEQEKLARWIERNRLAMEQIKQGLSKPLDDQHVLARLNERLDFADDRR